MDDPPLLLDTCVVLSLYATQRMEEILLAHGSRCLIAEAVQQESLYIHVVVDGVREKERVDLDPMLQSGMLTVVRPETDDEYQALFGFALQLDDGEAMTCALAMQRGYRMATDEKKTIRLIGNQIPIRGALDLIRTWETSARINQSTTREALIAIEQRGYIPGPAHPYMAWWLERRGD